MAKKSKHLSMDPNLTEQQQFVQSHGFEFLRYSNGNHEKWKHPDTEVITTLCSHPAPKTVYSIRGDIDKSKRIQRIEMSRAKRIRDRRVKREMQALSQQWKDEVSLLLRKKGGCIKAFAKAIKTEPPKLQVLELDANGWPMNDPKRLKHSPKLGPLPQKQRR